MNVSPIGDRHSGSRRAALIGDVDYDELTGEQVPPERAHRLADHEPHPSGGDRFSIYVVTARSRWRLADTSLAGIGLCLQTLREEGQITRDSKVGILDRTTRTWIVNPWAKGDA